MGRKKLDNMAIIKYYKPGSKLLAKAVSRAIKKRDAVVMANHGLVTVGRSLKEAYQRTVSIETKAGKLLGGICRGKIKKIFYSNGKKP
jgi:L-fuculose-phosphate aldolase